MKKKKHRLGNKVIIGFLLATFLVICVSVVTYVSIRNLLDTVENLSEPNERLRQLNGLIADVYLLDVSKGDRTSDKDSVLQLALDRIQYRLGWLKKTSHDTLEIESFEKINNNVLELLIGYAGLEEIRHNLTNNNFNDNALKSIETKILRRRQLEDMDFLQRIQNRRFFSEVIPPIDKSAPEEKQNGNNVKNNDLRFESLDRGDILDIARNLEELHLTDTTPEIQKINMDSILVSMKNLMFEVFQDEQKLRESFIDLEARLSAKNREIFGEIQSLVSGMQQNLLREYREQNESAYNLTYTVSNILAFLVFLGVIGSLGFVYSILTDVRQENSYLDKLEEAKKQSDLLAKAKQNFLANMSHEIRNPLHAIQGYQNALRKSNLPPHQKEFVEMIGFASETLMGIVNDILDFSKLEAGKINIEKEPFDPLKLFLAIKSFFAFKAEEKGLDFIWTIDLPQGKWLLGDQLRINQIISNLLSNALKFTQKGDVSVAVKYDKSGQLLLKVTDSGMGMADEVKKNIFQKFNQGDSSVTRKFGGTGLGLSIVKKLVDLHEGKIHVQSESGRGTEVSIQIPVNLIEPISTQNNDQEYLFDLQGLLVLVVDDDPIGTRFIRLILETHGANVVSYLGGMDFKENYKPANFDIAILDIQMPEVSGFKVLEILRQNHTKQSLPAIAMTANVFVEEKDKLSKSGFSDLILKPFTEDQIIQKVGELLDLEKIEKTNDFHERNSATLMYDLADVKKFCMADDELMLDIVTDLVNVTNENFKSIEIALSTGDWTRIREICHQLTSRLAQIKVPASIKARDIEISIKNENYDGISDKVKDFLEECKKAINQISHDFQLEVKA